MLLVAHETVKKLVFQSHRASASRHDVTLDDGVA